MSKLDACIVCLCTEVQLIKIGQGELRKMYNLISGLQTGMFEKLANYVCYLCLAYIRRFNAFRSKCQKTYKTLSELSKTGEMANQSVENIKSNFLGTSFALQIRNGPVIHCNSSTSYSTFDFPVITTCYNDTLVLEDNSSCKIAEAYVKYEKDLSETNSIKVEPEDTHNIIDNVFTYDDNDQKQMKEYEIKIFHTNVFDRRNVDSAKSKQKLNVKPINKKRNMKYMKSIPMTPQEQYQIILNRRISRNYLESEFKCELCYKGFCKKVTYDNHSKTHDPDISGPYQCDICKTYKKSRFCLSRHIYVNHSNSKYKCTICPFTTFTRGQAIAHNDLHKNFTHNCPHCERKFTTRSTCLSHVRIKHPSTVVCQICGHSFISKAGLSMHLRKAHSNEEIIKSDSMEVCTESPLYCRECKVQFISEEAFDTHLNTTSKHTLVNKVKYGRTEPNVNSKRQNSGPRKCEVCEKVLPNDYQALKHYKAEHPGYEAQKQYMCDICGHATKDRVRLQQHTRRHTREQPYECPVCNKRFSLSGNRDRHMRIHSGEKPYECPHCDRRFAQSSSMKLHKQTVHDKIPYAPWRENARKRKAAKLASLSGQGD